MLQIISGKFFERDNLDEKECDAVLHSNFSWIAPILTSNMQLRPIDTYRSRVAAYAVRYTSRYEPEVEDGKERKAVLVHPHHTPAAHQFRLLCCFFFRAFFHEDRHYVESQCRSASRHTEDTTVPSQFVPRFFDVNLHGTSEEVAEFPDFVDEVLGIPRTKYRLFVSCLKTFCDALESIETNCDLAYSMFVYLLETLSKDGDEYTPCWEDYGDKTRSQLDAILDARGNTNRRRIGSQDAKAIRKALLDDSQMKLTTRFVDGIAELVNDDFFLGESANRQQALPRSQLEQVLRNLYKTRSGYVHELRGLHDQLRTPGFASDGKTDLFVWDNEPYLTLAGVVRLTHHVLRSYLRQQPQLEKERYPQWRKELPGIVTVEFAPRYWIWQAQGAVGENAHSRFSGVVSHFIETFQKADGKLTDLRDLVLKIESVLGQTKADNRKSLLAIYVLWNSVIVESARSANRDKFLAKHGNLLESCSVQSFAVHLILGNDPVTWAPDECESCVKEYERRRHKRNAVSFPRRLEIALAVETANRFRDAGDHKKLQEWMRHAKMDAAGMPELQSEIDSNVTGEGRLSIRRVLGFHREGTE